MCAQSTQERCQGQIVEEVWTLMQSWGMIASKGPWWKGKWGWTVQIWPTYTFPTHPPSLEISIESNKYSSQTTATTFSLILSSKLRFCNLLMPAQHHNHRSPLISPIFLLLVFSTGALIGSIGSPTGFLQEGQQSSPQGPVSSFEGRKHGF